MYNTDNKYNADDNIFFNLEHITVEKGSVDGDGGGIWSSNELYADNIVVRNNNLIHGGGNWGGGMYIDDNLFLKNSLVENNSAYRGGGFDVSGSNTEIRNSIIHRNTATGRGGGFYSRYTQVYSSIISNNTSSIGTYILKDEGGAFYSFYSSSIVNSLIINNSTGILTYSGDSNHVVNSILSNNGDYDFKTEGTASVNIANSYMDGNLSITHFDTNVITNGDLGFVDETNGNYRLTANSILLDAGTIESQAVDIPYVDMDGNKKVAGGGIDIGPYEFSTTRPTLYSFDYTGEAKELSELTFDISYTLEDGRSLDQVTYDFTQSDSWTATNAHTFNTPGTYTVTAKVTDSTGEFSTTSKSITIVERPFSELTSEQKLIKAVNPEYYDEIVSMIEEERTSSNTSGYELGLYDGKVYVKDNLSEFNLTTLANMEQAIADTNATASASGIATGKAYVQTNPAEFNLVTTTDRDTAVATATTTATSSGIETGKSYVQNNPTEFSLYTQTDIEAQVATASATATAVGVESGKEMVIASPAAYGLIAATDANSSVSEALATGVVSGKEYVKTNPTEFGLVAKSNIELTSANVSGLSAGWTLVSTPFAITDLSVFNSATIVWVYSHP